MKIKCTKCKGSGRIPDIIERIATLGISYLFDKFSKNKQFYDTCPDCNGKGKIKI